MLTLHFSSYGMLLFDLDIFQIRLLNRNVYETDDDESYETDTTYET